MEIYQTIDMSVQHPSRTANFSMPLYRYCDYSDQYDAWYIGNVNGYFDFSVDLPKQQTITLTLELCSSTSNDVSNCPIDIEVNGTKIIQGFDPQIYNFYKKNFAISSDLLKAGSNSIKVILSGGTTKVFLKSASVDLYDDDAGRSNWLTNISDSETISDINLPGTHDSAAINTTVHTPYACHAYSITEQLEGGVRVLDVRLKVKGDSSQYVFQTCHGDVSGGTSVNEYQTFISLMDECKAFLTSYSSEFVVMTLKIDDWNEHKGDKTGVYAALKSVVNNYPIYTSASLPNAGQVRGKIVLVNRMNTDLDLGVPVGFPDNTEGAYASNQTNRDFKVYIQDKYKGLPTLYPSSTKLGFVTAAFGKKKSGEVLFNFASATWYGVIGVYIMADILNYFGNMKTSDRPITFGWTMFDYQFSQYEGESGVIEGDWVDVVDLIISSNDNYNGFDGTFSVDDTD